MRSLDAVTTKGDHAGSWRPKRLPLVRAEVVRHVAVADRVTALSLWVAPACGAVRVFAGFVRVVELSCTVDLLGRVGVNDLVVDVTARQDRRRYIWLLA